MAGRVVILNGTASAGKTTLAGAIHDAADDLWVRFSQDEFAQCLVPRWVAVDGVAAGELGDHGFHFVRDHDGLHVEVGDAARLLLRGYRSAAAACARAGCDVLVDECAFDPDAGADWHEALSGLRSLWVRVECDLSVCGEREARRPDRVLLQGLARGQHDRVHANVEYDVEVDLSTGDVGRAARLVLAAAERLTE